MMDFDAQLKLQAYLDGELPEREAAEVAKWVAGDQEAALLLLELRNTRACLAGFQKGIQLPESREFYWSKIRREMERLEPAQPGGSEPKAAPWLSRWLARAGGVAAVAVAVMIASGQFGWFGNSGIPAAAESALADNEAFSYRDDASRTTLVWLSYPADEEETSEPVEIN
jgi:anti-sigma factor RsiW